MASLDRFMVSLHQDFGETGKANYLRFSASISLQVALSNPRKSIRFGLGMSFLTSGNDRTEVVLRFKTHK